MDRASLWELWTPWVNQTTGKVCMQAHDGTFMWANEATFEGFGLEMHCMEHEQFEVSMGSGVDASRGASAPCIKHMHPARAE